MSDRINYQVIIVGGGPAGIATSLTLTARGISNCIIEADNQPKVKAGEALPPNAKQLLIQLNILDLVKHSKHIPYYGNKSCWGDTELQQKEFLKGVFGHGYLLDRQYFEKQLRDRVKTTSSILYEGFKLITIENKPSRIEVEIEKDSKIIKLAGSFIVDATGRKASVSIKLGHLKQTLDTQFALIFKVKLNEQIEQQIFVEATENGWFYVAPLGNNELNIMFFTLQNLIPLKKDLPQFLKRELKSTIHLYKFVMLSGSSLENVKQIPAGTTRLSIPFGENWLAVGDAAFSYDPISSYGITSALGSGYYAGNAISDYLLGNKDGFNAYRYILESAFATYMEKLVQHYDIEKRWPESLYWKNRIKYF
ncbi:NAD(P)/FAD-dependent oxidoreductase [Lacihabitans sp. LS3-19]|uniref:NAD(P)/FAD-dependent oxidoreductase n=1 Tax=Lacihabitans sp. LS3-19 TaxID=2487335 RepID=UPI0020CDB4E7|nr:NAD(P)/FAD-dependent oxidoreductase [Lacihabitans sp. LS3-19]